MRPPRGLGSPITMVIRGARTGTIGFASVLAVACTATAPTSPALPGPVPSMKSAPLVIAPGDVAELTLVKGAFGGSIATPKGDEQLIVVVASTTLEASRAPLAWSLESGRAREGAKASLVTGCSLAADAWRSKVVAAETAPMATARSVTPGATRTVHAPVAKGFEDIQVKAVAVGKHAVVWADVTPAHPAVLDAAFVGKFLADFDDTILPRGRTIFGVESDVDGDGRIHLIFTPLTREAKGTVAFFSGCDLVKWKDCATSNGGEYLWLTPPNAIDPPYNTPNAMKEILAHELAHLLHFNRKVLRNHASDWTDSGYLIEGVGGLAQDVIGPQAGNLYVTQAGLDGIASFSLGDVLVDGTPYDRSRDGVLRGGAYLFMRWLYDRAGGDSANADGTIEGRGGPALLRALLDVPVSVASALPDVTRSTAAAVAVDFYTTLAMSNRSQVGGVAPTNPCFSYLATQIDPVTARQRGADDFARFHGTQMKGPATTEAQSGTVRAGGVAYVIVTATAAPSLDLTVKVDAKAAPRVRVGRLR